MEIHGVIRGMILIFGKIVTPALRLGCSVWRHVVGRSLFQFVVS